MYEGTANFIKIASFNDIFKTFVSFLLMVWKFRKNRKCWILSYLVSGLVTLQHLALSEASPPFAGIASPSLEAAIDVDAKEKGTQWTSTGKTYWFDWTASSWPSLAAFAVVVGWSSEFSLWFSRRAPKGDYSESLLMHVNYGTAKKVLKLNATLLRDGRQSSLTLSNW